MIETARLLMIPYHPSHLLALREGPDEFVRVFGYHPAPGVGEYLSSDAVSPAWLEKLRAATEANIWDHGFGLVERESKLVIGGLAFKGPPDTEGMVEIAYGIAEAFQNRGFATEAAKTGVDFAFGQPSVAFVRAHTLPTNNASCRVLTKCGFQKLGEVIDPEDGLVWRWERRVSA